MNSSPWTREISIRYCGFCGLRYTIRLSPESRVYCASCIGREHRTVYGLVIEKKFLLVRRAKRSLHSCEMRSMYILSRPRLGLPHICIQSAVYTYKSTVCLDEGKDKLTYSEKERESFNTILINSTAMLGISLLLIRRSNTYVAKHLTWASARSVFQPHKKLSDLLFWNNT